MEKLKIDIEHLRSALNRTIDAIVESSGQQALSLEFDNYWLIPDEFFRVESGLPVDFEVGSLVDDLVFIESSLSDTQMSAFMLNHLVPLLAYLRYIYNQRGFFS